MTIMMLCAQTIRISNVENKKKIKINNRHNLYDNQYFVLGVHTCGREREREKDRKRSCESVESKIRELDTKQSGRVCFLRQALIYLR